MTRRHRHSRTARILAPLAALSLVAAACGDDDDDDTTDVGDTTDTTEVTDTTDATDTTDTTDDTMDADDGDTIVDIAMSDPDLSNLVAALESAELEETLAGEGPYTVFAPTNEAFETAVSDLGLELDDFLTEVDLVESVLLTHVIQDATIMSSDIEDGATQTSMSDTELEFRITDGTVTVNGFEVISADIEASNGVVHVIDGVLFPTE